MTSTQCLMLSNNVDISNNKYIINNNYDNIQYGLYQNINNNYTINNIPKEYPLGFYNAENNNTIDNIIKYELLNTIPKIIYVSRGNDISFNNGDYFRFYDESYNMINISNRFFESDSIVNNSDNFYFMINGNYKFIKGIDYDENNGKFELIINNQDKYNFLTDTSFIINIPNNVNNDSNKIIYYDLDNKNNIFDHLEILINNNIKFFYGDLSFTIFSDYNLNSDIKLSLKSYNNIINNTDIFFYSEVCDYIIKDINRKATDLLDISIVCLNNVSKAKYIESLQYYEFNIDVNRPRYNDLSNILYQFNYGLFDGEYVIFDICENFPIAIQSENNNFITIDENFIYSKRYNFINPIISELDDKFNTLNFYYDSIKFIVDTSSIDILVKNLLNINFYVLDISNKTILYGNNEDRQFVFNNNCEDPELVNGLTVYDDISFIMYDQQETPFYDENKRSFPFKLNKFEEYNELPKSFEIFDKYGYSITNRALITIPNFTYNSLEFQREKVISYSVYDYQNNFKTASRIISLQNGPFIEINDASYLFQNNNTDLNIIKIQNIGINNTYDLSYEFLNTIEVYFYDNNSNKIHLPFQIYYEEFIYDTNIVNPNSRKYLLDYFVSNDKYIETKKFLHRFYNRDNIILLEYQYINYYFTNNLIFNVPILDNLNNFDELNANEINDILNADLKVDSDDFNFINIDPNSFNITLEPISSYSDPENILNEIGIITFKTGSNQNKLRYNSQLENITSFSLSSSAGDENKKLIIDLIKSNFSTDTTKNEIFTNIKLTKKFDRSHENKTSFDLSININLINLDEFNIKIYNNIKNKDGFNELLTLNGKFADKQLFDPNNFINLKKVKKYNLTIKVLGLDGPQDFIYSHINEINKSSNTLSYTDLNIYNKYDFESLVETTSELVDASKNLYQINRIDTPYSLKNNHSRNIIIDVYDNISPDISFILDGQLFATNNNNKQLKNDIALDYKFSNSKIYFLKNNINVVSNNIFTESKPTINYIDDCDLSIPDNILTNQDLSYILIPASNVPSDVYIYDNINHTLRIKIEEAYSSAYSFTIIYCLIDKSHQKSNELTINLTILGIPSLDLQNDIYYNSDINLSVYEVNSINYIDPGIKIDNINVNTQILSSISNVVNFNDSNIPVNNIALTDSLGFVNNYIISIIKEIDFNDLKNVGIFKIQYKVTQVLDEFGLLGDPGYLIRNIKIVDITEPFLLFPDINNIIFDFSNNDNRGLLLNRNKYSNHELFNDFHINLSIFSSFDDLSLVVNSFDASDNYFNSNDIICEIRVQNISDEDISENNLYNFDKFIFQQLEILSEDEKFIKVTQSNIPNEIIDISNIYINYKVTDLCNNTHKVIRKLNIIDNIKPYITFHNINDTLNAEYVIYTDLTNKDISYQAIDINNINNSIGEYRIIEELSNILFGFYLSDNYNNSYDISKNFNIKITSNLNNNHSYKELTNIVNSNYLKENRTFFDGFKTKGNKYNLIYNIYDNQNNTNTITRELEIVNDVKPTLTFKDLNEINNQNINFSIDSFGNGIYYHNFGEINIDFKPIFNYTHPRIDSNSNDSIIIKSILPDHITSISGDNIYDPSFLINIIPNNIVFDTPNYKRESITIEFYSYIESLDLSSLTLPLIFVLENRGPNMQEDINDLRIESGVEVYDISFIENIMFISNFDIFYYYNYINNINYTETNFKSTIINTNNPDISFNQNSPEKGNYTITYESEDLNRVKSYYVRNISVTDELTPDIKLLGNALNNNNIEIIINREFIDPGVNITDIGSKLKSIDIKLYKDDILLKSYFQDNIDNKQLILKDISSIGLSHSETFIENSEFKIIYIADDVIGNIKTVERNIIVVPQKNIFVYIIEIIITFPDQTVLIFNLDENFNTNFINYKENYSYLEKYDITYENNKLEYEATKEFDINFNFNVKYFDYNGIRNDDVKNNISITDNIPRGKIKVGNYQIYFQTFETTNYESVAYILNIKIKDTKPPNLSFIESPLFLNISKTLYLPLLSLDSKNYLLNDINYFNNINLSEQSYFTFSSTNYIIYKIPGINIDDTVHGLTNTTSQETLLGNYVNIYIYDVDYSYMDNVSNTTINVENSFLPLNENTYFQQYSVFDRLSENRSSISRNLIIKRLIPFINLNYQKDSNNNTYFKFYHELYNNYLDLLGEAYDYYDGKLVFNFNNKLNYSFDQNILGNQRIDYIVQNRINQKGYNHRNVHVIKTTCLPKNNNIIEFINSIYTTNIRIGLFDGIYDCKIESNNKGIRIFGMDVERNYFYNVSNLVYFSGNNTFTYKDEIYYTGEFSLIINGDFNRLSVEIIDIDNSLNNVIYYDCFIFSEKCEPVIFTDQIIQNDIYEEDFILDICLNKNNYLFNNEIREQIFLSFGKYRLINNTYKNFYNPIKFSLIKDGYHNTEYNFYSIDDPSYQELYHYDKNILFNNLPGQSGANIEIIIDATTPPLLYYYNEKFKNMTGEIIIKNNILFSRDYIVLNGNILTSDNSNVLTDFYDNDDILKNSLLLSLNVDLPNSYKTKSMIGLTHKNLNHNIKFNDKKIILSEYIDSNNSNTIKHDISENYLFDYKENNKLSQLFAFKYVVSDNSNTLINTNNSIDFTEIFFRNREINNYHNFFKKNLLLGTNLNVEKFLFKTNELQYQNQVKLIDAGKIYEFFNNRYFSHYEPTFTNILDNILLFNLQVYLNIDLIEIEDNKLQYLRENVFNKNLNMPYSLDNNQLFFNNFLISILSDIPKIDTEEEEIVNKSIIFTNGNIEFNDYLLHSNTTNDYLFALYGVRLQEADVYHSYDFRTIYNTNNWERIGNVELLDSYIFIPNNGITNIDIQNRLIIFSYSTNIIGENILLYSTDNKVTYKTNPLYFKNRINKMYFKDNKWLILTSGYNGIYTSDDGIIWTPKSENLYRKITYYKSLVFLKDFTIYNGSGVESIAINNKITNEISFLDIFDARICNKVIYFDTIFNNLIFFCGVNNSKDRFCVSFINENSKKIYDISNVENFKYFQYSSLIQPFKFINTTIANDIYLSGDIVVFVGFVDYYRERPFMRNQSSIFFSLNNGRTFHMVSNSNSIFKYGFRVIKYNDIWLAFGSDVYITGNDSDIRDGKINYNHNYYVNKFARSNNGIAWNLDTTSNLFDLIYDIENIEIKDNTIYVFGNNKYIVYSYNTIDWFVLIDNFPLVNNSLIYFNNFNENIESSSVGNIKLNYVKLDPYTSTNNFTIEIVVKFHTLILGDDDIILNSSKEIIDSDGNIDYINKILIKRLKDYNNKLYIATTNGNEGHDILIDFSINTLNYYHILIMQNNNAQSINDYKIVYINGEKIDNNNLHNIYYTEASNNLNYILPIDTRDINYINNHTSSTNNSGISLQYINFYNKILIYEKILDIFNNIAESIDYNKIEYDNSNNLLFETKKEEFKNKIFLTFRDTDFVNEDTNRIIGLTEQNLYHNLYIEDNTRFLFHKYSDLTNNIQVITENTSLENTLSTNSSNKNYLLEICNNDIYNCFINTGENNIIDNHIYKNNFLFNLFNNRNDVKYQLHLSYFIYDELKNNNINKNTMDFYNVKKLYTNNLDTTIHSTPYGDSSDNYHTNFFVIDILDFIDRNFYNSSKIKDFIGHENINYDNLNFIIQDISYNNNFNLYDLDNSINIIYDKESIYKLNYLQIYIHSVNIKLNYSIEIFKNYFKTIINGFNNNDFIFINDINLQNYQKLFEDIDYVSNIYSINLPNISLNDLFALCLFNVKTLINKYNSFFVNVEFHNMQYDIINSNIYDSIINFTNVDQILTDTSFIELRIDNLLENMTFRNNIDNSLYNVLNNIPIVEFLDFIKLRELVVKYYKMHQDFNILLYELRIRTIYYSSKTFEIELENMLSKLKDNIFNYDNISDFYQRFLTTLTTFNNILIYFLENNSFMFESTYIDLSINYLNINRSFNQNITNNISINNLILQVNHIESNFNYIINKSDNIFDFISKLKIFDKINYLLTKSRFALNLIDSNNVTLKIETYYNSFLFNNIYLDTLVIDIAKPHIIPPTIVFNNNEAIENTTFVRDLRSSNIENIVNILIADISYISMHSDNELFTIENINYYYNNIEVLNNDHYLLSLDLTAFETNNNKVIDISYIVRDFANNVNIITRPIKVESLDTAPRFFYFDEKLDIFNIKNYPLIYTSNKTLSELFIFFGITADDPDSGFSRIPNIEFTLNGGLIFDSSLNSSGFYVNGITYKATGRLGQTNSIKRDVSINLYIPDVTSDIDFEIPIETKPINCCYPKVYYKEIQHNYKLGSASTTVSRLSKIIVNNIR